MDIIDAEDCARLLHCSVSQIEDMARTGDIPGFKIGRAWLFVRPDLLAYLAEKARREAQERRERREAVATPPEPVIKPARRPAPRLPTV